METYLLDDPEIEKEFQSILKDVPVYKNGLTVESMESRGLKYETSWGVSIIDLKKIAQKYEANQLLAIKLWNKGWRETMILSTLLDEPDKITEQMLDYRIKTLPTIEIAEQAVMNMIPNTKFAFAKAVEWCRSKKFLVKYTGLLLIGRLAFVDKKSIDEMFEIFFEVLLPLSKDAALSSVYTRSFCQLGRRSKALNILCIDFAEKLLTLEEQNSTLIASEVIDELKSDFVQDLFN